MYNKGLEIINKKVKEKWQNRSESFIDIGYVVVQLFFSWFKFYFPLFWGIVMTYDNEFKK